ncbi:MAG: restriction endonuclease subunit S [Thermoguttaceae bacterium]
MNRNLEKQALVLYKNYFDKSSFLHNRTRPLGDIAEITMGQSPKGSSYNTEGKGEVFYQGRGEFGYRFPTRRLFTTEPKRMAEENDILLSVRAPVGDINIANERCCIGRGLGALRSKNGFSSYLLYTMLTYKKLFDSYNSEGTVFGSIGRDSLNNLLIPYHSLEHIEQFDTIVKQFDKTIRTNFEENQRLVCLRDMLLPRLMSGELDVSILEY